MTVSAPTSRRRCSRARRARRRSARCVGGFPAPRCRLVTSTWSAPHHLFPVHGRRIVGRPGDGVLLSGAGGHHPGANGGKGRRGVAPAFDHDLRPGEGAGRLAARQLVAEAGAEALDMSVLPGAARLHMGGRGPCGPDPGAHGTGDGPGPVIGPRMRGRSAQDDEVGRHVDDVRGGEPAVGAHRQAPGERVDRGRDAGPAPVMCPILHDAAGPHVARPLRPEADARGVVRPEPRQLRSSRRSPRPLAPPGQARPPEARVPALRARRRVAGGRPDRWRTRWRFRRWLQRPQV